MDAPSENTAALQAAIPPQQASLVCRGLLGRLHELDSAPITLGGGDTVDVVSVPEVRNWLEGWVARLRAGERL